jgi:hypothetical protein
MLHRKRATPLGKKSNLARVVCDSSVMSSQDEARTPRRITEELLSDQADRGGDADGERGAVIVLRIA